jgi:hypothetical protein
VKSVVKIELEFTMAQDAKAALKTLLTFIDEAPIYPAVLSAGIEADC